MPAVQVLGALCIGTDWTSGVFIVTNRYTYTPIHLYTYTPLAPSPDRFWPSYCSTTSSALNNALAVVTTLSGCEGTIVFDQSTSNQSYELDTSYTLRSSASCKP